MAPKLSPSQHYHCCSRCSSTCNPGAPSPSFSLCCLVQHITTWEMAGGVCGMGEGRALWSSAQCWESQCPRGSVWHSTMRCDQAFNGDAGWCVQDSRGGRRPACPPTWCRGRRSIFAWCWGYTQHVAWGACGHSSMQPDRCSHGTCSPWPFRSWKAML